MGIDCGSLDHDDDCDCHLSEWKMGIAARSCPLSKVDLKPGELQLPPKVQERLERLTMDERPDGLLQSILTLKAYLLEIDTSISWALRELQDLQQEAERLQNLPKKG